MVNFRSAMYAAPLAQIAVAFQDRLPFLVPFVAAKIVVVPDEPLGAFGLALSRALLPYSIVELFSQVFVKVGDLSTPGVCLVDLLRCAGIIT